MNPGQKRSYPFSDDENLADQQVNFNFLTHHMQMHEKLQKYIAKIHIKCIFGNFTELNEILGPKNYQKGD